MYFVCDQIQVAGNMSNCQKCYPAILFESYLGFDQDVETALEQATKKTQSIRKEAEKLARHPFRETLHDDILQGLRHISIERAIYWFDILEDETLIRILAIFYGGQDHHTKILMRLLGGA